MDELTRYGIVHRVSERDRKPVAFYIDGAKKWALEGDTVLTAILTQQNRLRQFEFSDEPRAGFCLMGACQDCWVWTEDMDRIQACTTFVTEGLSVLTRNPKYS